MLSVLKSLSFSLCSFVSSISITLLCTYLLSNSGYLFKIQSSFSGCAFQKQVVSDKPKNSYLHLVIYYLNKDFLIQISLQCFFAYHIAHLVLVLQFHRQTQTIFFACSSFC